MPSDFGLAGDTFTRYLARRIQESASGASLESEYVYPDRPRDRFFVGRLAPVKLPDEDALENTEDFYSRLDPSSMRVRFLLRGEEDARILVKPRFLLFIRVFPGLDLQRKFSNAAFGAGRKCADLVALFRRYAPTVDVVQLKLTDLRQESSDVPTNWNKAESAKMPNIFKGSTSPSVSKEVLISEESFSRFLAATTGNPVVPDIRVFLSVSAAKVESDLWEISIALVNRSIDSDPFGRQRLFDEVIFDAGFDLEIAGGVIQPYIFPSLPKSYRFNRRMYGTGVNCTVKCFPANRPTQLGTKAVPIHEQKRFDHRNIPGIEPTFAGLSGLAGVQLLNKIAEEMRLFDQQVWEQRNNDLREDETVGEEERGEFSEDRAAFRKEIRRFEDGIRCLQHPLASQAFDLMNASFGLLGGSRRDRWRLFQIVFIVSMLPAVVGREDPSLASPDEWEIADVIWFPTGGGKTEAYLGLTVFSLFFDRLRGRTNGVTALYRFPLRLLSLQQFQRIVKVVAAAENIRRTEHIPGEPFTVGHWIGSQGSPNQITSEDASQLEEDATRISDGDTSVLTRKYRKISECPNIGCGNRAVYLRFDRSKWTLVHTCPSCGDLPLYIVDRELYRFLPSVIVGTVDKLAVLGMQRRFINLMGWTKAFCPDHGYASEDKCEVPGCTRRNLRERPIKDPVPTLHVQDELHLLKEDLGAFDAHYETSLLAMQREVPGSHVPWKNIAATATIEEFERHIDHLYQLKGRRFPTPGPYYERTFFADTEPNRLSRVFIGVNPHGYTHINAMVSLQWYFHREISSLRSLSADDFLVTTGLCGSLDPREVSGFLDQYEISLTYVLTKKAGDQMAESLEAQVTTYLKDNGFPELVTEVLNGGASADRITQVIDRIEKSDLTEPDFRKRLRSIVATSMISHGVDIERFNFITFFGMPRLTSEYIQASSRIGRTLPGIVLMCFAPARERDRSHYHFFSKYHEYLDRLVEPAAINRWAKFSIDKTFPGVLLGYLLNNVSRRVGRALTTEKAISGLIPHTLNTVSLIKQMVRHYRAENQASGEFARVIDIKTNMFVNGLNRNANTFIGKRRGWKPMRSLRDTDREVKFFPSKNSAPVFDSIMGERTKGGEIDSGAAEVPGDE